VETLDLERRKQSGQMAIFVALLFQVLFVFFAMVINIGLMVHDKINLQNSVDLAAIYGAQRQAEILNAIAHTNFQIRQSWKLLSWRVRVLGDFGRTSHPSVPQVGNPDLDVQDPYLFNYPPSVCVDNNGWMVDSGQNTCKRPGQFVPPIKNIPRISPFPIYDVLQPFLKQSQEVFSRDCRRRGPQNWAMAARWLAAYKLDVANRKQTIWALADTLKNNEFKELSGGNVLEGVRKTLLANLTRSNREAIDPNSFQFFNSLAGIPRSQWLPDIPIVPILFYTDATLKGGSCTFNIQILNLDMGGALPVHGTGSVDPTGFLEASTYEANDRDDPTKSIWGFEKNPWYMAYVGLKVSTKPKHPFSPFGRGVPMVAKSFAKPFGGRLGPWLYREWQPDQEASSGDKVDLLSQDRMGTTIGTDVRTMVPNFSRYPGDTLGLLSQLSLTQLREPRSRGNRLSDQDYAHVPGDLTQPNGDVLSWSSVANQESWIRQFEIAGIAPNYFDVMYYSIEPNWFTNYMSVAATGFFGSQFPLRQDLGGRMEGNAFTVIDQVETFKNAFTSPAKYFYQITNTPGQLLTAWAPEGSVNYNFPTQFADCSLPMPADFVRKNIPVPGSCVSGGRTGYSVKIISKSFLNSSEMELGGVGIKGPIKNKPPENF